MTPLRIGTRGSPLALWQAHFVADRLCSLAPDRPVELVEIETEGDRIRDVPLVQLGGQGAFTKAIQQALLENRADVAVHSLKDLPTFHVEGLVLAAIPERGPSGDAFVSKRHSSFASLPTGATVATSSLRRRAQILHRRPDLKLLDMRGNVETRLRKLVDQDLDALVLAEAGLMRLGLGSAITEVLDRRWLYPAVGQGALGLECRTADRATFELLQALNHAETRAAALAERAMLRGLGGGCQVPIGAATEVVQSQLVIRGVVLPSDGTSRIVAEARGGMNEAEALGQRLAEQLLAAGAEAMLGPSQGREPMVNHV